MGSLAFIWEADLIDKWLHHCLLALFTRKSFYISFLCSFFPSSLFSLPPSLSPFYVLNVDSLNNPTSFPVKPGITMILNTTSFSTGF